MDRSRTAVLIAQTFVDDDLLQKVPTETRRTVFCNLDSVTRAEWMTAGQAGFRPEYRLTMFAYDYQGESIVELKNIAKIERFSVYRTYRRDNDLIELYLEKKAGTLKNENQTHVCR